MLATLFLVALPQAPAEPAVLVKCERLIVAPGETLSPGFLLIQAGKVASVGSSAPADVPAGTPVLDFPGATVSSGLVDAHCHAGSYDDLLEKASAMTPGLRACETFDPFHREFTELARAGVTSCLLAPRSENVAGGFSCLVKTGGQAVPPIEDVVLKLSLSAQVLSNERKPTSMMGAVELLRSSLREARDRMAKEGAVHGYGPDDISGLNPALSGQMTVALTARRSSEIMSALEVIEEFSLKAVLLDAREADEAIPAIRAAGVGVILAPLRAASRKKELALPATLERERIPFAFCSDAPAGGGPDALRISASLAVRNGLAKDAAFTALTMRPAALLGVEARVGTLRPGRDADFVVWSGHPVDLSSRILAVHVNGKEVFRRKESES